MKERPILFSAPMVRAILDGTKTQTRSVVKFPRGAKLDGTRNDGSGIYCSRRDQPTGTTLIKPPHGVPGDRLWVRETWRPTPFSNGDVIHFAADGHVYGGSPFSRIRSIPTDVVKWRSPIHMPRWASRITLEVTRVRVERLNDISEADALAEGVEATPYFMADGSRDEAMSISARDSFVSLWSSIAGASSWAANPWVWAVEFKQVTP